MAVSLDNLPINMKTICENLIANIREYKRVRFSDFDNLIALEEWSKNNLPCLMYLIGSQGDRNKTLFALLETGNQDEENLKLIIDNIEIVLSKWSYI